MMGCTAHYAMDAANFIDIATIAGRACIIRDSVNICRRAGIKDFHFHDLRHTFASHLVMAGVDITTVSKLLGHKSLTMTLRYAHLAPSHLAEGVKKLDFLLSKQPNYDSYSISIAQSG
jgi:integrase